MVQVAMPDLLTGTMTCQKHCLREHPSMMLASSSSRGTSEMKPSINQTIKGNDSTMCARIMAENESIMCIFENTK